MCQRALPVPLRLIKMVACLQYFSGKIGVYMARRIEPHKTVHIMWGQWEGDIDEGIAPLIHELWKAGLLTLNSCEENQPGIMWIEFADVPAAETFLDIVTEYDPSPDSLYSRIRFGWTQRRKDDVPGTWLFDVGLDDMAVEYMEIDEDTIDERSTGPCSFIFSLSVRFPETDYPTLLNRMMVFNKRLLMETNELPY